MSRGGCKTCPVVQCDTVTYRGSRCASLRAAHGLGDPMTNEDRVRVMSREELVKVITMELICQERGRCISNCEQCVDLWLQSPVGRAKV